MLRNCVRGSIKAHRVLARNYAKDVLFGQEVRAMMLRGVDVLADAVAVTMGPKGRCVILDRSWSSPKITKDGVTVARAISLPDKHMNLGAKLVQDVAFNTNVSAGDGTTTATVLARAIAKEGLKHLTSGVNPVEMRRGIKLAVDTVTLTLEAMSRPVVKRKEIEQVATLSSNGDVEIGRLIADATEKVGLKGIITVKEGKRLKDELEIIEGLKFDKGYISPLFINTHKGAKVELNEAYVLITMQKITALSKLLNAMELAFRHRKPLIIIAEDVTGEALNGLLLNRFKMGMSICAIKAPEFGDKRRDFLGDIAAATGARVFGDDANFSRIEKANVDDLGVVGEAVITKDSTMLLNGRAKPDLLSRRIKELQDELEDEETTESKQKELQERLCRLTKGVAVLHIGGHSELEVCEKRERANDALNATRAAIEEGIVPGGGTAFLRCIPELEEMEVDNADRQIGVDMVCNALRMPCITIATNAGVDAYQVVTKVMNSSGDFGYDALRGVYGNMIEKGIIDPTKVLCTAISDAAGIASLLNTTEVVITDVRDMELFAKLANFVSGSGTDELDDMDLGGGMDTVDAIRGSCADVDADIKADAELNEAIRSMPGMENVQVHDIDANAMA